MQFDDIEYVFSVHVHFFQLCGMNRIVFIQEAIQHQRFRSHAKR